MALDYNQAREYEYRVARAENHRELEELLNLAADQGWAPVEYAVWSRERGAKHFVILRRPHTGR
jgi:hypothetical protein